ncbi:peptidoglycan DD-metalloendopeptidase family protein [Caulobacter mirabilis]|nr:peptidoglycan DD-metalloendopeptidase family protein [Caulobacter mirabilis]
MALAAPVAAQAHADTPPRGYTCPPCGCVVHGRLFSSPGVCPVCGMKLVAVTAPSDEPAADFPAVQLEMRTPLPPTAVPSAGREHLIYELHIRNFGGRPVSLGRLEVLDANTGAEVAHFERAGLEALVGAVGQDALTVGGDGVMLGGGRSCVIFLRLTSDSPAPAKLLHRLRSGAVVTTGQTIDVAPRRTLRRLGPPLQGSDWVPTHNPGADAHHRVGLVTIDGAARIARRYAIDWKRRRGGAWLSGDEADVRAYYAYGQPVIAVADATVVTAVDGFPDNRPRTREGFTPALELSLDSLGGNVVILDLGDGLFAGYAHLQPGSVMVRAGDRVRRGQVLAAIGNSGDSRWPHLHFQVSDGPSLLGSEGFPYVIDAYSEVTGDKSDARRDELPMRDARIDFA